MEHVGLPALQPNRQVVCQMRVAPHTRGEGNEDAQNRAPRSTRAGGILPTVDRRKGHAEQSRERLLGKPKTFTKQPKVLPNHDLSVTYAGAAVKRML